MKNVLAVGQRVGRGVVIETGIQMPPVGRKRRVRPRGATLRCDCGAVYTASVSNLTDFGSGIRTQSCGCLARELAAQRMRNVHAVNRARREKQGLLPGVRRRYGAWQVQVTLPPCPTLEEATAAYRRAVDALAREGLLPA